MINYHQQLIKGLINEDILIFYHKKIYVLLLVTFSSIFYWIKNFKMSPLRQFPQMIIALDKYTRYMFTSSPNCMMSSSVAMEILCITNIGSISQKKIAVLKKCCKNVRL